MKVLVIAPHADDEIIGVGGTIIKHIKNGDRVYVCIVTKGAKPLFSEETVNTIRRETIECHTKIGIEKTYFLEFPSVMLESVNRYELNNRISDVIQEVCPNEVYIPHIGDMQKDHQMVTEAAMVGLRPKYKHRIERIYAYETLSETGWNIPNVQNEFIPNVYVDISNEMQEKLKAMECYASQLGTFPEARSLEAIEALAKFRGTTANISRAEAFSLIREIK